MDENLDGRETQKVFKKKPVKKSTFFVKKFCIQWSLGYLHLRVSAYMSLKLKQVCITLTQKLYAFNCFEKNRRSEFRFASAETSFDLSEITPMTNNVSQWVLKEEM